MKPIFIFDVDGTLTLARQKATPEMVAFLSALRSKVPIAAVGGSDLVKITEQLADNDVSKVLSMFDYVFSENGVVAHKAGKELDAQNLQLFIGDDKLQKFINHSLRYLSDIVLPCKRGNFVEFRRAMINVSPIGRSCSQAERDAFVKFDTENKVREKMLMNLRENFPVAEYGLQFSIGGQISIDVFPVGWDKTFCLKYLNNDGFDCINFFGDKTAPGGNDHEIFEDSRTVGHTVTSPDDTIIQVKKRLAELNL